MHLHMIGMNHHSAPLAVREKLAIGADRLPDLLRKLGQYVPHGIILSTCNRTEIYTSASNDSDARQACARFIQENLLEPDSGLIQHLYSLSGRELAFHLFRVVCGLDSLALGEYEILGQVGKALEAAEKAGAVNTPLRHLFHSAVRTGRRARLETGISSNALSISSIAVNKALDVIPDISRCKTIILGAGEAGRLALRVALSRGASRIAVVSRSQARAASLTAQYGGSPVSIESLAQEMRDADIIIGCANSPHAVLHHQMVANAMIGRADLPLIIVDIAVPRNVEDSVRQIANVHLYNLDNLNDIAGEHRAERENEVAAVQKIIAEEADRLMKWWQAYSVKPMIKSLMQKAEKIRTAQYNKTIKKLPALNAADRSAIDLLTRSVVDKILRHPILYLKSKDTAENQEIIKRLFDLEEEGSR